MPDFTLSQASIGLFITSSLETHQATSSFLLTGRIQFITCMLFVPRRWCHRSSKLWPPEINGSLGITVEAQSIFISALRPRGLSAEIITGRNIARGLRRRSNARSPNEDCRRGPIDRILKVGRTSADQHISETVQYRTLDRNFWT